MSSLRQAGARRHRVVGTVVGRLVRVLACCMPAGALGCMPATAPLDCTHAGGTPMLEYQLFFGRGIPGRTDLTDREWAEFAEQVVTPNLPDGFTAFDADGQWRNPQNRQGCLEKRRRSLLWRYPTPRRRGRRSRRSRTRIGHGFISSRWALWRMRPAARFESVNVDGPGLSLNRVTSDAAPRRVLASIRQRLGGRRSPTLTVAARFGC